MPKEILGVPVEQAAAIAALAVLVWNVLVWLVKRLWQTFRSPVILRSLPAGPIYSGPDLQYELAQLWLVNRSRERFPAVTAEVFVKSMGARATCLWAVGTPPGQMAQWQMIADQTDLEANDLPHKLNVALKYPSEEVAYLFSLDNRQAHPDFRDPTHAVPLGRHRIRVRLRGHALDREFDLSLEVGPGVEVVR